MHRNAPRPPARPAAFVLLAAALAVSSIDAHAGITIGPGPAIGTDRAGVTWYQEFQDWSHADLRALDDAGASDPRYLYNDGLDDSRDLVAFYHRIEGDSVWFRVDVSDLALGAENTGLNLYLAIDAASGGQSYLPDFVDAQTDHPWELCVNLYQSGTVYGTDYRIYDAAFNDVTGAFLGSYWNSQLDAVEFGIRRSALITAGWDGARTLYFQPFTTKDGGSSSCPSGSRIADAFLDPDRGCSDGVLRGAIASSDTAGLVYYASIAHGNQSVNQADDIGAHIYDPQANTGISGGTGFQRTLDTHEMFHVPLNIHPSGTLTVACQWAALPGGASDPQDGPGFVARVREFVDADQASRPGSLIGGVFAEHLLPYFEGPVNAASFALEDSLNQVVYGVSAADAKVMHIPERVIRSQPTGLSPLDGRTFEDIAASPYQATVIDEVTHLHHWFYPGEACAPDQAYRHKLHRVNGVYCFVINDREDQAKFGNWDGGATMDSRASLLEKARAGNASEIVVVFDDWEALAGKSFDAASGHSVPNDNPNQYHRTIRWLANHPWVRIENLRDLLAIATANPAAFVIDHGSRDDLGIQTYEWLKHAAEDSYNNWYYDSSGGVGGNEQSFYDLVPVITGAQGDYHARGATPAADGPPLPSGRKLGDMNTPGTLLHDTWAALAAAPPCRMRELGIASFLTMIYETAWHEEDALDYSDSNCYGAWLHPDASWDGVNTWALRLQNHVRNAAMYAVAAQWVHDCETGAQGYATVTRALDVDLDGQDEYLVQNRHGFAVFERWGGRCVLFDTWDPGMPPEFSKDQVVIGAPFTNPSSPGEEELSGSDANTCSGFKDMNGGAYVDAAYTVTPAVGGWTFTSPDGRIVKTITMADASCCTLPLIRASYHETVAGPLYVRFGLSPNPMDLAFHGDRHLVAGVQPYVYSLENLTGGAVELGFAGASWNGAPADAGLTGRNLALAQTVEVSHDGDMILTLLAGSGSSVYTGVPPPASATRLALAPIVPSPSRGRVTLAFALPRASEVRIEVLDPAGRRVRTLAARAFAAGRGTLRLEPRDAAGAPLPSGLYLVRVTAGAERAVGRWVVLR